MATPCVSSCPQPDMAKHSRFLGESLERLGGISGALATEGVLTSIVEMHLATIQKSSAYYEVLVLFFVVPASMYHTVNISINTNTNGP